MNKRKILTLALSLCMVAILAIGGTLAYFTDTDSAKNVMTLGGVNIVQNEYLKDLETTFVDNVDLLPMVDKREDKEADPVVDGWFDEDMENVVDKAITVKNEADAANGTNKEAYVRTLIAFEGRSDVQDTYIGKLWNKTDWEINWVPKTNGEAIEVNGLVNAREVMINGVVHTVVECIYVGTQFGDAGVLPAGQETAPSLKQIFMAPTANNEISVWFGPDYTIYALTQATQIDGFTSAEEALDTAFGDPAEVDDQTMFDWFKNVQ